MIIAACFPTVTGCGKKLQAWGSEAVTVHLSCIIQHRLQSEVQQMMQDETVSLVLFLSAYRVTGDCACAQQVTRPQIAPSQCVMCHHLWQCPVPAKGTL